MFELFVAFKYLLPKWRQLSLSIISLISVGVIAAVVWLILVFFSVTAGLEKSWVGKLVTLTAPIRLTPTESYYQSFYHLVDTISEASSFSAKSIREKLLADQTNPYNEDFDEEIPSQWPAPDLTSSLELKDLVKEAFLAVEAVSGLRATPFELAPATLRLELIRMKGGREITHSALSQATYFGSFDHKAPNLKAVLIASEGETNAYQIGEPLPKDAKAGFGILLPRGFKEAGVAIGDKGYLTYLAATTSSFQEQRLPVFVSGFYDPGILPMGGKFALGDPELIHLLRQEQSQEDSGPLSHGINVQFEDLSQVDNVKKALLKELEARGISNYWTLQTFREYDFSKDLIQQLRSEKNLFTLISLVILLVACSNIISLLIILVNDKKVEIGILRSMGATTFSIASIFGFCGFVMGSLGSLLGLGLATLTLQHLNTLISWISAAQGFEMFNPLFYGDSLPKEMSLETLVFVCLTTAGLSVIAGIIPAIKACLVSPSSSLASE